MKSALTYVRNPKVKEIIEWTMWLQENLRYPNSETSKDEARYTEIYEEKILELIKAKK